MASVGIRGLLAPLVIMVLGLSPNAVQHVPLFAQFATEDPALRSYIAPLHISVAIHKLFTFHFGLDGTVYFRRPGRLAMTMQKVPEQYQKLFAKLGTPRTWPQTYDLQIVGTDETASGQKIYHVHGVPFESCEIDHMDADVGPSNTPVKVTWTLRDGGTIVSTIESTTVGGYSVPKEQHADINAGGFKIHADMLYGDYEVNGQISDAVF